MMMDDLERQMQLAVDHHRAGRLSEAEAGYRRVLSANPEHADAMHLLGLVALQVGKATVAIELIERAIKIRKDFPAALSNLGYAYQAAGRVGDAIGAYRRAVELAPELAEPRVNLGNALVEIGKADEAIEVLQKAVELKPDYGNAFNSLGTAYRTARRYEESAEALRKALAIDPNHAEAHNNLGNTLRDIEQQQEAIGHFERAIALRAELGQSYNNLAGAYEELGQYERAIETYRKAINVQPELHMSHMNLGIALLRNGDFQNGWNEYEWRYRDPEIAPLLKRSDRPVWTGADLGDKTLLIQAEQGLGDTIQFVRYLPMVAERAKNVILRAHPQLMELFGELGGTDELISFSDVIPAHDVQCPLLSLPKVFGTNLSNIPAKIPYLNADPGLAIRWLDQLSEFEDQFKVGVCWAGRAQYANDRRRSVSPELLAPLASIPNVRFVSLQKTRDESDSPGVEMSDWTNELVDLSDTAALIGCLNLVITVDTSIAHLAGAMGKPVWILLPYMPDWRWMRDREDSPWYPTARLFRQTTRGDWKEVAARVAGALRERAASFSPGSSR